MSDGTFHLTITSPTSSVSIGGAVSELSFSGAVSFPTDSDDSPGYPAQEVEDVAFWTEVAISTDESDWDNSEGGWTFNGDGTVSSTNVGSEAFARLPLTGLNVAASICHLRLVGHMTATALTPDCWFGINDGTDNALDRSLEMFWHSGGHVGVLAADKNGIGNDVETSTGLNTDLTLDAMFSSGAAAVWLDGEPFGSFAAVNYALAGTIEFGTPYATSPQLLLQNSTGVPGVTFDLSASKILVPAIPSA